VEKYLNTVVEVSVTILCTWHCHLQSLNSGW